MENIDTLTLAEIVRRNYKAAAVFEKFGLDFCCMGNQNFAEACEATHIEPSFVLNELNRIQGEQDDGVDFDSWPLDLLVDYILKRHHSYIEQTTPGLKEFVSKICKVHGANHPELEEVKSIFFEVSGELAVHMKKEELMLFPFIKKLAKAKDTRSYASSPIFGTVSNPIDLMKVDHAIEGEKLRRIASLTNNYRVPDDGCNTFSVTYKLLEEFERDLHMHIHLENNILFPKAILLEEQVSQL